MRLFRDIEHIRSTEELIEILRGCEHDLTEDQWDNLMSILRKYPEECVDHFDLPELIRPLFTAITLTKEMGIGGTSLLALLLQKPQEHGIVTLTEIREAFGEEVAHLLSLLQKVADLYEKNAVVSSENFSHFLLSFAEDIRVIIILIAERLVQLRLAGKHLPEEAQIELSVEASFLYAPLAHRLGLYNIKSEMEDLCLKYTDRESFNFIKDKLSATKRARDAYIGKFIEPVEKRLSEAGLKYEIKGRTKSISSIRNKLLKQKIEFEAIYDLFAIRIILDTPLEEEREQCWRAYSIVTDMFQPNPKRLKDWISIPKSNGYESLHITVMGPDQKWVEVQIRTRRMDEVAEKGLAAHWRYKGVKSESALDDFMTGVRSALESKAEGSEEVIEEFKMNLYDEEIYVFTPKGDLLKLPKGATVLDFAFGIHSGLGCKTASAQVNGRNVSIRHKLQNGDTVSVNTSSNQSPKADWLSFVVTSKARNKIKQVLRAESEKAIALTREELQRKMRNRKLEFDESLFTRLLRKKGYKATTNFFKDIQAQKLDINSFLDDYKRELEEKQHSEEIERISADQFCSSTVPERIVEETEDVLVIDNNLSGIDYQRAKCCNPIYGDKIFAFASRTGVKIHRMDCPNAQDLFKRYGYRVLKAQWKGNNTGGYEVSIKVIGQDNLSVVHNITSQISAEKDVTLRSYNIESGDGLFQGYFNIYVKDSTRLKSLLKTLREAKGVKQVDRLK